MDLFLRILLLLISFFVPFAFAGAEPWAFSVLQGGVCVLLAGVLFGRRTLYLTPLFKWAFYILGILILYTLIQCICTQTLLMPPAPYPATLMRLYSLEHASWFVTYLAWVFVVMQLEDTSKHIGRAVGGLILCAVLVALCAFCFGKEEYIQAWTGIARGFGPFLNRNHGGIFLAGGAVLCLGWVSAAFAAPEYKNKKLFWVRQFWGLATAVGLGVAAVFSRSRGGMLSLAVGIFSFAFWGALYLPNGWKKRLRWLVLIGVALGGSVQWTFAHLDAINTFARRSRQGFSVQTRRMLYRAAGEMWRDYTWWGIGVGALPVVVTSYTDKPLRRYVDRLHSDWLEMAVGLGSVGSGLVLLGLGGFAVVVLRRFRYLKAVKKIKLAALLSTLLVICTGALADFPFFIPATALLFFWMVGLSCSPSFWKERITHWVPGLYVRLLILAVLWAACVVPLQNTLAWRMFVFGKNRQFETRIRYYQQGLAHYPSPHFALRLGNAYYNASQRTSDPAEKTRLLGLAHQTAADYLRQYPREKELSRLYMLSRCPADEICK